MARAGVKDDKIDLVPGGRWTALYSRLLWMTLCMSRLCEWTT